MGLPAAQGWCKDQSAGQASLHELTAVQRWCGHRQQKQQQRHLKVALGDAAFLLCPFAVLPDDAPGVEEPHETATPQLAIAQSLV